MTTEGASSGVVLTSRRLRRLPAAAAALAVAVAVRQWQPGDVRVPDEQEQHRGRDHAEREPPWVASAQDEPGGRQEHQQGQRPQLVGRELERDAPGIIDDERHHDQGDGGDADDDRHKRSGRTEAGEERPSVCLRRRLPSGAPERPEDGDARNHEHDEDRDRALAEADRAERRAADLAARVGGGGVGKAAQHRA